MNFDMTITIGSIINLLSFIIATIFLVIRVSKFTSTIERRIDKLDTTLINQQAYVLKLESVTKADIVRLEEMGKSCYVKAVLKTHDDKISEIEKNQIELRAELPLQLEAIRKDINDLSIEVKGMRKDIANRRKTDGI